MEDPNMGSTYKAHFASMSHCTLFLPPLTFLLLHLESSCGFLLFSQRKKSLIFSSYGCASRHYRPYGRIKTMRALVTPPSMCFLFVEPPSESLFFIALRLGIQIV